MRARSFPAALALAVAACARAGSEDGGGGAPDAPRRREAGERLPAFSGGDPESKGWVRAGDLWVEARHADAFAKGLLWTGEGYEPAAAADRRPGSALDKYVLRTDHVVLRTNVPFERARALASQAQAHVRAVVAALGEPLDLRLPAEPLPVVVAASRAELEALLRDRVARPVDWGAFYSPKDGAVYASEERRRRGGLPVLADLRHEMTHAILDLGRRGGVSDAAFTGPHFWLWEGVAVWAESLGDPHDARVGVERERRLRRRLAWGEAASFRTLFRLPQEAFEGRHYDQAGSVARWLLEAEGGARRAGTLRLLVAVMEGRAREADFERLVGLAPEAAERAWRASLG
jgi:hypothetical protein